MFFLPFLIFADEPLLPPVVVFACLHLWNATCSCPFSGCLMTLYFPMFFLLRTRQINSCPSSLLPPHLPVSPASLVVFPYQYFGRLGPAFKCARVLLALLSLRKNGGLLVVYTTRSPSSKYEHMFYIKVYIERKQFT